MSNSDANKAEPLGLRVSAVRSLLHPKSIAILGVSAKPGSAGQNALGMVLKDKYPADVHLVGRSGGEVLGKPVLTDVAQLPENVDLAILTLPASGVCEAIEGCISRGISSAVVFASGFAETGEDARDEQTRIAQLADVSGLGVVGPNCLGFTNYVDGLDVGFLGNAPVKTLAHSQMPAVAIVAQSGGLMGLVFQGLEARGVNIAYRISTGNEAGLGLSDYVAYMAEDPAVGIIVMYAEQIRRPAVFLEAVARARAAGKTLVLMHTGRGENAQHAAASHTGALSSNYAVMKAIVERAGVLLVESLEELTDCTELLARYPTAPTLDPAVATTSGALCAIVHDYCEDLGLALPPLSQASVDVLTPRLPEFTPPKNPLDLTTQTAWDLDLIADATKVLLDDPEMGSVTIAVPSGPDPLASNWLRPLLEFVPKSRKPVILSILADEAVWPQEFERTAREAGMIMSRSPERALRTIARVTQYGRVLARAGNRPTQLTIDSIPALRSGPNPEWLGKQILSNLGVTVPSGDLASSPDAAVEIASRIGYPVALKVQAAELAHKTEIGGVKLGIANEGELRSVFDELVARAEKAKPGVQLDGILVEAMSRKGLELVVGATRDPHWGVVILVGLGGILVEAIKDVRLLPADLGHDDIIAELGKLKSAKLFGEFRGSAASDLRAVADVVVAVGQLMTSHPEIVEIDINPLMVFAQGEGACALDALIVTS